MPDNKVKTAWLIDDDEMANFIAEKTIRANNFAGEVLKFTTIESALYLLDKAARREAVLFPDFIFLDINMPGLDGWDFLDSYAELPHDLKSGCRLYMLSSSIDMADHDRSESHADTCGFIQKPLSPKDLDAINLQLLKTE